MTLTPEQVTQFKTHGYSYAPGFFSAQEVAAFRAELDRLKRQGKFNNVATVGDGKTPSATTTNLQICPLHPHSTLFRAVPFAPQVLEAIPQLIGDPVVLHLDQVFLKPGRHGAGTAWHQDNAYFQIPQPFLGTAMWIAVHDATLANGTLRVIPDRVTATLEHTRDPNSNHHIRCYPDESLAVPIEITAGGVIFFAYGTPHATGPNHTDHSTRGIAYHFLHASQYRRGNPAHAGLGTKLTGPEASGGRAEYGVAIASTFETEVAKALGL